MKTKTKDGIAVEKERVETVAMILGGCTDDVLHHLDAYDTFMNLADRFIAILTEDELRNFIAHNVAIKLMQFINS